MLVSGKKYTASNLWGSTRDLFNILNLKFGWDKLRRLSLNLITIKILSMVVVGLKILDQMKYGDLFRQISHFEDCGSQFVRSHHNVAS